MKVVFCLALLLSAAAQASAPELALSVPEGTDLAVPGVKSTQQTWLEMIRGAKKTIDLGQFYIATGGTTKAGSALDPVINELVQAGKRGVKMRMVVSNELLDEDPAGFARVKAIPGMSVRVYNIEKLTGGIIHAKYWIVDGAEIYVGSANFDYRSLTQIHETGLRVRDARLAQQLSEIFKIDWEVAGSGKLPSQALVQCIETPSTDISLVASPPQLHPRCGTRHALEALLELMNGAKESIQFQLLDYSPVEGKEFWPPIDNALRAAAQRGVKVSMLVSDWNSAEKKIPHLKSLAVLPNMDVRMASIPQPKGEFIPFARVIHSKVLIVDGRTLWVGTSNWGKDYFESSRNVELIVRTYPELTAQAARIYSRLWNSAYVQKVDPSKTYFMPKRGEK